MNYLPLRRKDAKKHKAFLRETLRLSVFVARVSTFTKELLFV
jgi:hypothetical protein